MGICGCKGSVKRPIKSSKTNNNPALDKWQDKHIEILKNKFKRILKSSESTNQQCLDRRSFMEMFNDLKDLPKDVVLSMFRFFDTDNSGMIDFREFCTGLSLLCLSSKEERIKVIFQLFDSDNDNVLNSNEFENLLQTSIIGFRKFSKGPGGATDIEWIAKQKKAVMPNGKNEINFDDFWRWAQENLNLYNILNTFEIVPSPQKEKQL